MINRPSIDTLEFARKGQTQHLQLRSGDLRRLTDDSIFVNDTVKAKVIGGVQKDGKPFIEIKMHGELKLTCQRCLELYDLQINSHSRFIIATDEMELVEVSLEEEGVITLLAEQERDLVDFVEEELLLALPMVPLHEEGECTIPQLSDGDTNVTSPFKGLRKAF